MKWITSEGDKGQGHMAERSPICPYQWQNIGLGILTYFLNYSLFFLLELFWNFLINILLLKRNSLYLCLPLCFQIKKTVNCWRAKVPYCSLFKDTTSCPAPSGTEKVSVFPELSNKITLYLVKVHVPLSALEFISMPCPHCTLNPPEGTNCFLPVPGACACIQVAWLQQHYIGYSLNSQCVCSFEGPSSGNS